MLQSAMQLRQTFLGLAKTEIPRLVGQQYSDAVVACLNGLEEARETNALADQDDVVLGLVYITQVVKRLEEISI